MFDILPLYGVLWPHSSHQISFTFYGHPDIVAQAKALCEVEGGPTYEIILRGEASLVNYSFDTKDINYGLQVLSPIGRRFFWVCPKLWSQALCSHLSWNPSLSPLSLNPNLLPNPDHPHTANRWPDIVTCFSHHLLKFCMLDTRISTFPLNPKPVPTSPFLSVKLLPLQGIFHCTLFASPHILTAFRLLLSHPAQSL